MKLLELETPKKGKLAESTPPNGPLALMSIGEPIIEYDPNQPRADDGKFGSGQGKSASSSSPRSDKAKSVMSLFDKAKTNQQIKKAQTFAKPTQKQSESDQDKPKLLLFGEGFKALAETKKESISGTSFGQVLRADVKKESHRRTSMGRVLRESEKSVGDKPSVFRVVLIQEGLGNARDCYWYSKEALKSGIKIFEGKKCFINHQTAQEESSRPERDVEVVAGYFKNVGLGQDETGRAQLEADLKVPAGDGFDWVRDLLLHAIEYHKDFKDKELIGLSIVAGGDSEPMPIRELMTKEVPEGAVPKLKAAAESGIEEVNYVSTITEAISCDLVTEAGAGGKIISAK